MPEKWNVHDRYGRKIGEVREAPSVDAAGIFFFVVALWYLIYIASIVFAVVVIGSAVGWWRLCRRYPLVIIPVTVGLIGLVAWTAYDQSVRQPALAMESMSRITVDPVTEFTYADDDAAYEHTVSFTAHFNNEDDQTRQVTVTMSFWVDSGDPPRTSILAQLALFNITVPVPPRTSLAETGSSPAIVTYNPCCGIWVDTRYQKPYPTPFVPKTPTISNTYRITWMAPSVSNHLSNARDFHAEIVAVDGFAKPTTVPSPSATATTNESPIPNDIAVQTATPVDWTPTPVPTPTPAGNWVVVGNTGGDGVYLRNSPHMADKELAWPDGTRLKLVGPDTSSEGRLWAHVRDPDGNVGWVPKAYIIPAK